jgi:hypothetical protein
LTVASFLAKVPYFMNQPSIFLRTSLLLALGVLSLQLAAQMPGFPGGGGGRPPQGPSITGRIQGIILDSLGRQPVEFATVVLMDASGSRQVDGTVTEADGSFKLINVKTGSYKLTLSYLGYAEKSFSITTTPDKPDKDMGTVLLSSEGINLEQVTVTGEAALVENRIDKLVYNAEKDVSNAGGDAADVLRRVPLLQRVALRRRVALLLRRVALLRWVPHLLLAVGAVLHSSVVFHAGEHCRLGVVAI